MNLLDRKLSFDLEKEVYAPANDLYFKDEFKIVLVESYVEGHYDQDTMKVKFQPTSKPFEITELINIVEGGKLTILLKNLYKRKRKVALRLKDLNGETFRTTAVKKTNGFFTVFPEVLNSDELAIDKW